MSAPASTPDLFDANDLDRIAQTRNNALRVKQLINVIRDWEALERDEFKLDDVEQRQLELRAHIKAYTATMSPENKEDLVVQLIIQEFENVLSDEPPFGLLVLLEQINTAAGLLHVIRYVALVYLMAYVPNSPSIDAPGPWFSGILERYAQYARVPVQDLNIDVLLRGVFSTNRRRGEWMIRPAFDQNTLGTTFALECAKVWFAPTDKTIKGEQRKQAEIARVNWFEHLLRGLEEEEVDRVMELVEGGAPEYRIKPRAADGRHHTPATRSLPSSYEQVRPTMGKDTANLVIDYMYEGYDLSANVKPEEPIPDWRQEQLEESKRADEERGAEIQRKAAGRLAEDQARLKRHQDAIESIDAGVERERERRLKLGRAFAAMNEARSAIHGAAAEMEE